jgi:tetratricopeptide (TPR) repeat protein
MYRLHKNFLLLGVALTSMLPLTQARADYAATPQEAAMCKVMVYDRSDPADHRNWMHMHHYCDCLRFINRAYSAIGDWKAVHGNIQRALGTCDYVLEHTTPDFYMRAEVHLQKGKALRLDRQENRAVGEFLEAIKGNPGLDQAYAELADIQAHNKKRGEALKTVTEGLRHVPGSKPLKRRYTELGGKLPYPAPIATTAVAPQAAKPDDSAASAASASAAPATSTADTQPALAAEPAVPPKIGSPTNPYCRFCPD